MKSRYEGIAQSFGVEAALFENVMRSCNEKFAERRDKMIAEINRDLPVVKAIDMRIELTGPEGILNSFENSVDAAVYYIKDNKKDTETYDRILSKNIISQANLIDTSKKKLKELHQKGENYEIDGSKIDSRTLIKLIKYHECAILKSEYIIDALTKIKKEFKKAGVDKQDTVKSHRGSERTSDYERLFTAAQTKSQILIFNSYVGDGEERKLRGITTTLSNMQSANQSVSEFLKYANDHKNKVRPNDIKALSDIILEKSELIKTNYPGIENRPEFKAYCQLGKQLQELHSSVSQIQPQKERFSLLKSLQSLSQASTPVMSRSRRSSTLFEPKERRKSIGDDESTESTLVGVREELKKLVAEGSKTADSAKEKKQSTSVEQKSKKDEDLGSNSSRSSSGDYKI